MDTLESILSSAVSDMVADMLTQRVLLHAKNQDMEIEEDRLSSEVEKLVRNLLGMKNRLEIFLTILYHGSISVSYRTNVMFRESSKWSSTEYPSTHKGWKN